MTTGIAFVVGFSVIFICEYYLLEGVLAITIFQRNLDLVNRIAGAIIMVLALQTMGVLRFGWLERERRFHLPVSSGAAGGLLLGLTFAAGWLPCLGPQLGAILTIAQNREFGGLPFMILYCLGLAVPFLLVALLADRLGGVLRSINRHLRVISIVAGRDPLRLRAADGHRAADRAERAVVSVAVQLVGGGGGTGASGSQTVTVVPAPSALRIPTSPPWARASPWTMLRPRPLPPSSRARVFSPR